MEHFSFSSYLEKFKLLEKILVTNFQINDTKKIIKQTFLSLTISCEIDNLIEELDEHAYFLTFYADYQHTKQCIFIPTKYFIFKTMISSKHEIKESSHVIPKNVSLKDKKIRLYILSCRSSFNLTEYECYDWEEDGGMYISTEIFRSPPNYFPLF